MSLLGDVIDVFEGEAKRILWLPALTLGYTFTLSGTWIEFTLAVAAIGGARLFGDISDRVDAADNDQPLWKTVFPTVVHKSRWKTWFFAIIAVSYAAAVLYGGYSVYTYFDHTDIVLVGLAAVHLGIALIVVMNIVAGASLDQDYASIEPESVDPR